MQFLIKVTDFIKINNFRCFTFILNKIFKSATSKLIRWCIVLHAVSNTCSFLTQSTPPPFLMHLLPSHQKKNHYDIISFSLMRLYLSNNIFNWKSWPKNDSIVHVYTDNHYIKHKTKLSLLSLSLSLSSPYLHCTSRK